ncbi:hypothetical protein DFA_12303 [Cavenderia fasciculata]|uniref:DUF4470 domain-containing protein n=1 Tax=Cavenderia fasciculata TaxID=261658 RepID=F4QD56_CACFS|nr:uncharacterized protein DFA_12303 [Cavenderia fasciculata]EGG14527.1 hypothetical protein DFA_12303 [Cavenderia fasciculata]|eukprot:XP_004353957.1 hypothetical protein DFA_12303 [Cavenderia fasciculata]
MSSNNSEVEELRASGNKKYIEKRYKEAITIYQQAIKLSKDDATFPSNMAACCFELGDYDRNLARIARIVHLKKPKQELIEFVNQVIDQLDQDILKDKSFDFEKIKKSVDTLDQEDWTKKNGSGRVDVSTLPSRLPARSDLKEYFIVGHDTPKSALSPHVDGDEVEPQGDDPMSIMRIKEIEEERILLRNNPSLSFFYGGAGDCRHALATLADLNRQLVRDGPPEAKIHFTLNDLVPSVMARGLLFFSLLEEIGHYDNIEKVYKEREAANAAVVLYYTYIGVGMPVAIYNMLVARLEKLVSLGDSDQLPKWMSISAADWPGIRDSFKYWIEEEPVLTWPQVKKKATDGDSTPLDPGEESLACDKFNKSEDKKSQQMEEIMSHVNDPKFLAQMGINPNDEAKKKQLIQQLTKDGIFNQIQEVQNSYLNLPSELDWLHVFRYPMLPVVNADYGEHMTPAKAIKVLDGLSAKVPKRVESFKIFAKDDMIKVNPTFFDPVYARKTFGDTTADFAFKPINIVADFNQYVWVGLPKHNKTLFDHFIHVFYQTARGLVRLSSSNALVIEMRVGDYQSVLESVRDNKEERKASGMAVEYDSIYLSNVPDYTGYLSVFTDTIEMLKPVKHSYIGFNIFLNTSLWKSFDDTIHTYLLVPGAKALPRYLGVKSVGTGDLWQGLRFSRVEGPIPLDQLVGRDELVAWLSRLFISIVTPSAMEPRTVPINSPDNIAMFFKFLGRLLRVGYPPHWISGMVQLLLTGSLTTVEPTRKKRIMPVPPPRSTPTLKKLSIKPWIIDIRTQAALWMDKYQIRLLDATIPSAADIKRYDIKFGHFTDYVMGPRSNSGSIYAPVIMLAIEYPNQLSIPLHRFNSGSIADDNLRFQLLDPARNQITIITTILCDKQKVSFWMSESDYNNLVSLKATIKLSRCDIWKSFTEPIYLK